MSLTQATEGAGAYLSPYSSVLEQILTTRLYKHKRPSIHNCTLLQVNKKTLPTLNKNFD